MPVDIQKIDPEIRDWLAGRPQIIRELFNRKPPGVYRVREGAPYSSSAPGCEVILESYLESGEVSVRITKATAEAESNFRQRCAQHGRDPLKILPDGKGPVGISVIVDPQWLSLIEVAEGIRDAWIYTESK